MNEQEQAELEDLLEHISEGEENWAWSSRLWAWDVVPFEGGSALTAARWPVPFGCHDLDVVGDEAA